MAGTKDGVETERETVALEVVRGSKAVLSVLIASYRNGEQLFETLKSVLDQAYERLEVVVCDDGSEDFDEDRLRTFAGNRAFKQLHHKTNMGTVRSLNEGLALCEGEWVMLLAADDALSGDHAVSALMERAGRTDKDWLVGPAQLCDGDLHPTGRTSPTSAQMELLRTRDARTIQSCLCRECFLPSSGTVYRIDLLRRLGGFDTRYRLVEDWPLFLKLLRSGNVPELLDTPVTLHRADGVSQKAAGRNRDYQRDLIETMRNEILPYLDLLPAWEKKEIETLCRDKQAIYQLRFETHGFGPRLGWFLRHLGTVSRKLLQKIR